MVSLEENSNDGTIGPGELKDGQMAVVVSDDKYHGRIVQRCGGDLIAVGLPRGDSWPGNCGRVCEVPRVRVLGNGSRLVISQNT